MKSFSFARSIRAALCIALFLTTACGAGAGNQPSDDGSTASDARVTPGDTTRSDTGTDVSTAPFDARTDATLDATADANGDSRALDARTDVAVDTTPPPFHCTDDVACTNHVEGAHCDVPTGTCVECLATSDDCATDHHCEPTMHACVAGCRTDDGCPAVIVPDVDGGAGTVSLPRHCALPMHACVACTADAHCPAGTVCSGFACVPGCTDAHGCAGGAVCCAGGCVDTQSSLAHCGACGHACTTANGMALCTAGACATGTCTAPYVDCNGTVGDGCEANTGIDTQHCGTCNTTCAIAGATTVCANGACGFGACVPGRGDCNAMLADGCETDTLNDPANCGGCANACSFMHASGVCRAGTCSMGACATGFADCNHDPSDGCELDVSHDPANCGACGTTCMLPNATATCTDGACAVMACNDTSHGDCDNDPTDGCETDLRSNTTHCGSCATSCRANNTGFACRAGACAITVCTNGFTDCDHTVANGCETATGSDTSNCGTCGTRCTLPSATPVCTNGACAISSCNGLTLDCNHTVSDGCEVNGASNVNNCGSCGHACSLPHAIAACTSGACTIAQCVSGYDDQDGDASNGCELMGVASYTSCASVPTTRPSGVYRLSAGGTPWAGYCETQLDGGGWTLVLKAGGTASVFGYDSARWTTSGPYHDNFTALDTNEARFTGFDSVSFRSVRIGLADATATRYLVIPVVAGLGTPITSFATLIAGAARATTLTRAAWLTLGGPTAALEANCNSQGFNQNPAGGTSYARVRIGIVGNNENNCTTPESFVGIGGTEPACSGDVTTTAGVETRCNTPTATTSIHEFGYVFVR